jgi:peptidylprolyl isomerase
MTLTPDARGRERRVVIQLMPAPFSQGWVANIRTLAAAHWWDGLAVTRVQDNYVAQWGDPDGEDPAKARALPEGLRVMGEAEYVAQGGSRLICDRDVCPEAPAGVDSTYQELSTDFYAEGIGFGAGWPLAFEYGAAWPIHCYGMVGVGRGMSPDTGSGAELYTVIGHAPRHLDRNIALVGRVVEGIEHLSSLPRGTGPLGFYETPEERTTITAIRIASELPAADQPRMEYLSTESASFASYAEARANRRDPFFITPAGGADICNIPVPVRRVRAGG